MKRRRFTVASATALLTTGLNSTSNPALNQPVAGLEFNISAPENQKPSETDSILIQFDKLQLTPQYINDNEPVTVQAKLEADGKTETSNKINASVTNGQTKELNSKINPIQLNNINEDESIRGTVTVSINHPSIKDNYSQAFTISDPSIPDSALTQDLIAWYRFEDGDARDYASNTKFPDQNWGDSTAYNGTVNGATHQLNEGVTDFQNGSNSGSYLFDSAGDEIVDIGTIYGDKRKFTINVWIKPNNTDNIQSIVNNYTGGIEQCTIRLRSGGSIQWYNRDSGQDSVNYSSGNVNVGDWSMITAVRDGGTTRLYIDATEVNSETNNSMSQTVGNNNFQIGNQIASDQPFDGYIDDVRFYDQVLLPSEITNIYNNTKP